MNKLFKFSLIAIFAIFVSACSAMREPIETPSGEIPSHLTKAQVQTAITSALAERGWVAVSTSDNLIKATLNVRSHSAAIEIPYDNAKYQINYVSSSNLKDDNDGSIHNKYNHWVRNLQLDINTQFARMAVR